MKQEGLQAKINMLMTDDAFGKILRVKGFFQEDDTWYQFNATKNDFEFKAMPVGQQVFIVIGEALNEQRIKDYLSID
jgi:hypothetical protein